MKKKRTYGSVDVETIDPVGFAKLVLTVGCIVAVDVAKTKFVAAIADAAGTVLRILRFEHPRQTLAFLRLMDALQTAKLQPRVVMEPTGTYGDALRYQCHARGLRVEMMSPKHTHDIAEVLDGVPSMHDPKAAVALAQLAVLRPRGEAWTPDPPARREMRAMLDRRWPMSKTLGLYFGHLEAMIARHWPELDGLVKFREQTSWMTLLRKYPGPRLVAASPEMVADTLRRASRGNVGPGSAAAIVSSASTTMGVPMLPAEEARLGFIVEQIERETRGIASLDAEIAKMVSQDAVMARLAVVVGPACAAAIVSHVGSPLSYERPAMLEKAIGYNMTEKSSGGQKGYVHITKRGPAQVRQLLYLAVLRLVQSNPIVAAWYRARTSYPTCKPKALVAVARKLTRALWHVARGETFDACKLFDVRRLKVAPVVARPFAAKRPESDNDTTPDIALPKRAPSLPKQHEQGGGTQPHA